MIRIDRTENMKVSTRPSLYDGSPTIFSDGSQPALVSDRDGVWAAWAAPIVPTLVGKRFELPATTLWGGDEPAWLNERMP